MSKAREFTKKGLACLFALFLAVAFVPGLGVQPASADTVIANPSTVEDSPTVLSDGTYHCTATKGSSNNYYYFQWKPSKEDAAYVLTITKAGNVSWLTYWYGDNKYASLSGDSVEVPCEADNTIELDVTANGDFTLTLSSVEYSWGELNVSGLDNATADESSIPFTVSLTGAADDVSLQGWTFGGWHQWGDLSGHSGTGTLSTTNVPAGYWDLLIDLTSDTFLTTANRLTYTIPVRPAAVTNVKAANFNVSYNSAKITGAAAVGIGSETKNGTKIRIQQKKSGSWTTVKTIDVGTGVVTLSGLKAKTTYQYRFVGYVPASGGNAALVGANSQTITVKTGLKTAPSVKSVKVSGTKQKYVNGGWQPGRWDAGGTWHPGYDTSGHWQTTYTVKVTLKKKVSGTAGLLINGTKVKGTGKTFTTKITETGKLKGKNRSFVICSYRSATYIGSSKGVIKTAKVK